MPVNALHDSPFESTMRGPIAAITTHRRDSRLTPTSRPTSGLIGRQKVRVYPVAYEYRVTNHTSNEGQRSARISSCAFLWKTEDPDLFFLLVGDIFVEVSLYELEHKLTSMQRDLLDATVCGDNETLRVLRAQQAERFLAFVREPVEP